MNNNNVFYPACLSIHSLHIYARALLSNEWCKTPGVVCYFRFLWREKATSFLASLLYTQVSYRQEGNKKVCAFFVPLA